MNFTGYGGDIHLSGGEYRHDLPHRSGGTAVCPRANRQTIQQRAEILRQLGYRQPAIAEICCGDCQRQQQVYRAPDYASFARLLLQDLKYVELRGPQ